MQGDDPRYLRVVATVKHFAVFSGPQNGGAGTVSERDLRQTYLPAFKTSVKEARVASVMCSFNSPNGTPACRNTELLQQILRTEWGFDGFVTSDCPVQLTFASGCDLSCQGTPDNPTVTVMDSALIRIFAARIRTGEFDPPAMVPYASIPQSVNECPAHRQLARTAALKSMVLLKNNDHVLPLRKDRKVAVIGPHADWVDSGPDLTAPTIVRASGTKNTAVLVFSESVQTALATTLANYALSNGITITSATLSADSVTVNLTTSLLTTGTTYTVTVNNVRDVASTPNTIAANSTRTFIASLGINKIRFYPRPGMAGRMTGSRFEGTVGNPTTGTYVNLYQLPGTPSEGQWTRVVRKLRSRLY